MPLYPAVLGHGDSRHSCIYGRGIHFGGGGGDRAGSRLASPDVAGLHVEADGPQGCLVDVAQVANGRARWVRALDDIGLPEVDLVLDKLEVGRSNSYIEVTESHADMGSRYA